ncbi:MAG TPA: FAD-dependent oxidoreductase [Actinomycetota bacterium]|nr:FAD-dependent oxidoreductase [Actinomycetota bacterium]
MRDRAELVVIGAGIVGTSAAYHLAELGITDVLLLDQGPLFETGGSTSHAPGLVFQTNGSRTMCRLAQYSVGLYRGLESDEGPAWYEVGGIEVATTPERSQELKRRRGFARAYGIDGTELLTPDETAERIPILDPGHILGSYLVPSDGVAKGVRVAAALAAKAEANGISFEGGARVTGFDIRDGRVHGVRTDRGDVECERVLVCAGIWGPTIGRMAGVPIPLAVVQHQLVWTEPLPELAADADEEVVQPILRHQDSSLYFRQRGDRYAIGNYRHEPILSEPDDLRPYRDGEPQPSVEPFTPEDFEVAHEESVRLLPPLKDRIDPSSAFNGMFSFTPDMGSIVGESADVRGFWICEAVWVTHAGGMGRMVAEWMTEGEPSFDMAEADANRFYPFMTTAPYVKARGAQQYREVYDIIHPLQQMSHPRDLKLTPFHARHRELGAEFFSGAGWERPQWFEANSVLTGAPWESRTGWAARNWSPAVGAEHIATRERVAMFDITPFAKFDVTGADALSFLERISANRIDRPVGTIVYTSMLTPSGGIRCDLTITRKDEDRFRVVTGGGSGQHDRAWLLAQRRPDERVQLTVRSGSLFALGLWGPRARDVLQAVTDVDVSNEAFPYMTARYLNVGEVDPVWAQRISYAGELGWELYGQIAMGQRAWDVLREAGQQHGIVAAGGGAFDSLRLEKGYRLWGQDIHTEHDPLEAGLGFAVRMDLREFQGRDALQRILDAGGPPERLTCLTLDDPDAVVMGKEPILHDGRAVSYVTSAAYGYSIGRGIVYGYVPVDLAVEGTPFEVEYFGDRLAAAVAAEPLWDPKGQRLRA